YGLPADARKIWAGKALSELEEAIDQCDLQTDFESSELFSMLADAAWDCAVFDKAEKAALELLRLFRGKKRDGFAANAVHKANTILGRLAMRARKLEDATFHLFESVRIEGSPSLNSFGPSMELAKELLERGETKPVIEYLRRCSLFWQTRD